MVLKIRLLYGLETKYLSISYASYIERWPYPDMENMGCYNVVSFFIIVAAVLTSALLGATIQPAAAQQFSMSHRILLDNSEGNTVGWNPKW
jgi:hypothetical protein